METITNLSPIILALPFLMFLFLGLCGNKLFKSNPNIAGWIGTAGLSVVAIVSYYIAIQYFWVEGKGADAYQQFVLFNHEWLKMTDNLVISIGFMLDPISAMMLVVISTVSLMVHIYSLGYMHGEEGFQRYYAVLSLFTFAMMGLVVATNIFQMYIFWELVGVSSFLLISFYFIKPSAVAAAKKAFIVTRFADMFFLVGILILSYYTNTFDFLKLTAVSDGHATLVNNTMCGEMFMGLSVTSIAMFLIFLGGAGKSAMFPFHIWLPDAMEGPTPASALIHAATMVVAGVFLVARMFPVYFFEAHDVLTIIGYIGAFTSLFAAIIACTQTDIKRVLAFSTISQIAYMFVALAVSGYASEHEQCLGYTASMWHLFTHAMFKACLFLGAGCIIHAVHSNEMNAMGNLRKFMPIAHITFGISCLAIAGIPPFSGFYSKDEILVAAFEHDKVLYACQAFVAGLTAFYMFRLYFRIFWYSENPAHAHHTPHEAPMNMNIPLIVLSVFTCYSFFNLVSNDSSQLFSSKITADRVGFELETNYTIAIASFLVAVVGIAIAWVLYKEKNDKPDMIAGKVKCLYISASHRFYIDEIYLFITRKIIFGGICVAIAWFDRHIIDGFMNLLAWISRELSYDIRDVQSGNLQQYAWGFLVGVLAIAMFAIYY
ncbi:MAG: NADH-quinone oxidoreductase subunit L [Bacteroidales bacterium]|jgi:NADH-quinone oxidoreductase subunit L|nr:NADH-quinone oxidoreductase subunit L [Bacteroidales bacterium]